MAKQNFGNINLPPEFKRFQRNLGLIVVSILGAILLFSTWFTVGAEEAGVVLRLGKLNRTVTAGLHFKLPFGVENVYLIPIERQLKQEFGFRTSRADVQTRYSQANFAQEALMLTGDLNLAEVEWVVQYRINDPYQYLFKVRNPENSLRDISESVMRGVIGDRTVNEALTVGRVEIATTAEALIQELCNEYEIGIKIEQVVLQDVTPPDPVKPSFNAVNQAQQDRERLINEARSEYNKVVPRAEGQAQEIIQQAEGYALARVNEAQGSVARFNALFTEYQKAPQITRKRIYLETMKEILPKMGQKVITGQSGSNVLPLLNLNVKNKKGGQQ